MAVPTGRDRASRLARIADLAVGEDDGGLDFKIVCQPLHCRREVAATESHNLKTRKLIWREDLISRDLGVTLDQTNLAYLSSLTQKSAMAPRTQGISCVMEPLVSRMTCSIQPSRLPSRQHDIGPGSGSRLE